MDHVTRNLNARRAQLGIPISALEDATGMARQQFHRTASHPNATNMRSLQKIAMMLYCPIARLLSDDPGEAVRYPLPPKDFIERLKANRERLGFDSCDFPEWHEYEAIINAPTD